MMVGRLLSFWVAYSPKQSNHSTHMRFRQIDIFPRVRGNYANFGHHHLNIDSHGNIGFAKKVVCINRVELLYCKECVWSFWVCYGCIWHSKFITHISIQNLHLLLRKVVVHHLKPNDQSTQKGSFQAEGHRNKCCQDILMMPSFNRKTLVNWAKLRSQTLNNWT